MSQLFRYSARVSFFPETARGFTLIELLIVIVIISIITSFAVLSIHFNQNKQLESLTHQMANTFALAQQEALLRQTPLGFKLKNNTFQFYEYHQPTDSEANPWQPITNATLGLHRIPQDTRITLKALPEDVTNPAPTFIIISPSGDLTAFVMYIGKKNKPPYYKIVGTEAGHIKSELVNED